MRGARPPRDERGRHGPDDGAHLHAGGVREDRRAGRAREGRVRGRRHVHLAHAQRGQPAARSDRRDADDCARRRASAPRSITSRRRGSRTGKSSATCIAKIEAARKEGLEITADMYTYTAGSTGLDAAMPPWVQEGGYDAWARTPAGSDDSRPRPPGDDDAAATSGRTCCWRPAATGRCSSGSRTKRCGIYTGKTLGEVAKLRGKSIAGHGDGSRRRGRQPRAGRLLPDVGGQRQAADLGCRG